MTAVHGQRALVGAGLVAAALAAAPPASGAGRDLGPGAWSYFGDPRAVHHSGRTFVGWTDPEGWARVASIDNGSGEVRTTRLGPRLTVDDHNNPSLFVRWDGRVMAFYSPHSGHKRPPGRTPKRLYYRTSTRPGDISSFGPVRRLRTNTPGRLGYTYPNPVAMAGGRISLFWRGGNFLPALSTSRNGRRWTRARTVIRVRRPHRPYVKYAGDGGDTVHMAFTEGHPTSRPTNLYYARLDGRHFERADGRRLGTITRGPLNPRRATRISNVRVAGRAWVQDIALDGCGRPVVVYDTMRGYSRHTYRYAAWTGRRWVKHRIVARTGYVSFRKRRYPAGLTLDHEDPSVVLLARRVRGRHEVQRWRTPDRGATWTQEAVTSDSESDNIRPITPRGLVGDDLALWMNGEYPSYLTFRTTIRFERKAQALCQK